MQQQTQLASVTAADTASTNSISSQGIQHKDFAISAARVPAFVYFFCRPCACKFVHCDQSSRCLSLQNPCVLFTSTCVTRVRKQRLSSCLYSRPGWKGRLHNDTTRQRLNTSRGAASAYSIPCTLGIATSMESYLASADVEQSEHCELLTSSITRLVVHLIPMLSLACKPNTHSRNPLGPAHAAASDVVILSLSSCTPRDTTHYTWPL